MFLIWNGIFSFPIPVSAAIERKRKRRNQTFLIFFYIKNLYFFQTGHWILKVRVRNLLAYILYFLHHEWFRLCAFRQNSDEKQPLRWFILAPMAHQAPALTSLTQTFRLLRGIGYSSHRRQNRANFFLLE